MAQALIEACSRCRWQVVSRMLDGWRPKREGDRWPEEARQACTYTDAYGETPLSWAGYNSGKRNTSAKVKDRILAIVETLLEVAPSALRQRTHDLGDLPLHAAAWGGSPPRILAAILRAYPAALRVRNKAGNTPDEIALSCDLWETWSAMAAADALHSFVAARPPKFRLEHPSSASSSRSPAEMKPCFAARLPIRCMRNIASFIPPAKPQTWRSWMPKSIMNGIAAEVGRQPHMPPIGMTRLSSRSTNGRSTIWKETRSCIAATSRPAAFNRQPVKNVVKSDAKVDDTCVEHCGNMGKYRHGAMTVSVVMPMGSSNETRFNYKQTVCRRGRRSRERSWPSERVLASRARTHNRLAARRLKAHNATVEMP